MRIFKRYDNYYLDYTVNGKRIKKRAPGRTHAQAMEEMARIKRILDRKDDSAIDNSFPLGEIFREYLESVNVSDSTFKRYKRLLERMQEHFEDKGIASAATLRTHHIREFITCLSDQGMSNKTINDHISRLQAAMKYSLVNGYIATNPALGVSKLPKKQTVERRQFTQLETQTLLETTTPSILELVKFALYSGCRKDELLHLRWSDLDLSQDTIQITSKKGAWGEWRPKTDAGIREIPITGPLRKVIDSMLRERDQDIDWLFITEDKTRRAHNINRSFRNSVDRMLTKLHPEWNENRIIEERKKLVFHSLRYTFASRLANTGIPPKVLQKIMGHESIETTLKIYAKAENDGRDYLNKITW